MKSWQYRYLVLTIVLFVLIGCGGGGGGGGRQTSSESASPTSESSSEANNSETGSVQVQNPHRVYSLAAPEGNDVLSSSTNQRQNAEDRRIKVNGLEGATFVAAPQPNHFGTMSLTYPLDIPAGRAGMQPELALTYSSSSSDGWLGIGWQMGLPALSRSTDYGQLFYDSRDTFTYGGKRLVKVSGPSSNENGVYRLEVESNFIRFELTNIENGGVWTLYDQNGYQTVFGENLDNRIYHPDNSQKTYRWLFSRKEDRHGNFMEAEYDTSFYQQHHLLYLKEISYTGNTGQSFPARQYVRFYLKARSDFYVSKTPGFLMKMDRLLDRIEVGWDNQKLWDYRMVYTTSTDSGRPLLTTIDSKRTTTAPEFHYQKAEHAFIWKNVKHPHFNDPEVDSEQTQFFEGDFNGDALSDIVFFNPQTGAWKAAEGRRDVGYTYKTYATRFKGYTAPEKIQWFQPRASGDYNGDGRADIAFYLPQTREFWVAEHNGQIFNFRRYGRLSLGVDNFSAAEWFIGDFDGNGLMDVVLFNELKGEWNFLQNTGGAFSLAKFGNQFRYLFRQDYTPNQLTTSDASDEGQSRQQVHFLNGDYNGDGRTDISFYDARDGHWWVGENHYQDSNGFRLEWKVYKIFSAPEQTLFGYDRFSGDFNGDGLSDFLLFDRSVGQWILGTTEEGTIGFTRLLKTPQYKDITRWLQGDFNGDGRTDIGFYSETDQNFWIGEATHEGFRYRIYNNLRSGPDPDTVMATPLPEDLIKLVQQKAAFTSNGKTLVTDFSFDGRVEDDRGELPFVGCFSATFCTTPELLLFDREQERWNLKTVDELKENILSLDLNDASIQLLNNGQVGQFLTNQDELLYYQKKTLLTTVEHQFHVTQYSASQWSTSLLAQFEDTNLSNFKIEESAVLIDQFNSSGQKSVLVFDDQAPTPRFVLITGSSTPTELIIAGAYPEKLDDGLFKNGSGDNRNLRSKYRFFSGVFPGSATAQVLLLDQSGSTHQWYLGAVNTLTSTITFTALDGTAHFAIPTTTFHIQRNAAGIPYHVFDDTLVYATESNGQIQFRQIKITETNTISSSKFSSVADSFTFRNEFDHLEQPILHAEDLGVWAFDWNSEKVEALGSNVTYHTISREDLMTEDYPFQWIQGDYNGDGKTDIGIFHLKAPTWYYALTTGTVPDLINQVDNGIGGTYSIEYANSSQFDHTGSDDIPDLPFNYKVMTALTTDDGLNHTTKTTYQYRHGHTFSAFIDGKKETDYFGFGELTITDAYGGKTVNTYHNSPHTHYLKNRALGGALKESVRYGEDGKEFERAAYTYKMHTIDQGTSQTKSSYLAEAIEVVRKRGGVSTQTTTSSMELAANAYELKSLTTSETDHYSDTVHSPTTITTKTEYETTVTNQRRVIRKTEFQGTAHETQISYAYDSSGNLIRQTASYTGTGLASVSDQIIEYDYDAYGNRIAEENVSASPSRLKEMDYDSTLHQFLTEEKTTTSGSPLITTHLINYAQAFGQIGQTTDPNGNKTYFDYDSFGRLAEVEADTDSGIQTLHSYDYSASFPLSGKIVQFSGTTSGDLKTRVYYDGLGREIHTVKSAPNNQYIKSGLLVYDALGRVIRQSQPNWANASEIDTYQKNPREKHPTRTLYDPNGRVQKTILPKAYSAEPETSVTFTYSDPWEVTETHGAASGSISKGKTTITNGRGQVLYVTDFGKGDDNAFLEAKMGFCYDLRNQRVKKMDLNVTAMSCDLSNATTKDTSGHNIAYWQYDGLGQLVLSNDPDRGVTQYALNAFGDRSTVTDALSQTTQYVYDRAGRLTQKTLPGTEGVVIYTYDTLSGSANTKGRLVALDDPTQRKEFSFDKLGRVAWESRKIKNPSRPLLDVTYLTTFRYNLLGQPTEIDYPTDPLTAAAVRVCTTYGDSLPVRIDLNRNISGTGCSTDPKAIISDIAYDEFNQMTQIDYSNGVSSFYEYDDKRRLLRLQSKQGSTTLQDVTYAFNIQDSIQSISNHVNTHQTTYTYQYDGLDRLIDATGYYYDGVSTLERFHRQYSYALNGNLTEKTLLNPDNGVTLDQWTYAYSNHAVTDIDTTTYGTGRFSMQYDGVGNMTSQSDQGLSLSKQLTYDSYNQIKTVTNPTTSQVVGEYWYDDDGFRVRKISTYDIGSTTKTTELIYPSMYFGIENGDPNDDEKWNVINNIYLNGVRVAAAVPNGETLFYLGDQVDSVKLVVDDSAAIITHMEYYPYGESWDVATDNNHAPKYNSQEFDKETKFYYYNARYYDPIIGRFITADRIIDGEYDTQGWNRYSYVKGNPIRYSDPTGQDTLEIGFSFLFIDFGFIFYDGDKITKSDSTAEAVGKGFTFRGKLGFSTTLVGVGITGTNTDLGGRKHPDGWDRNYGIKYLGVGDNADGSGSVSLGLSLSLPGVGFSRTAVEDEE